MEDKLAILLAPILSAAVTGCIAVVGVFLSNKNTIRVLSAQISHDNNKSEKTLLRERGEELYEITAHWIKNAISLHLSIPAVMKGEISYNQHLDIHNQVPISAKLDFQRLEMLIDVYFPSLRDGYDRARKKLDAHNDILSAHKKAYKDGIDGLAYLEPFYRTREVFVENGEIFLKEITIEIKNLENL